MRGLLNVVGFLLRRSSGVWLSGWARHGRIEWRRVRDLEEGVRVGEWNGQDLYRVGGMHGRESIINFSFPFLVHLSFLGHFLGRGQGKDYRSGQSVS